LKFFRGRPSTGRHRSRGQAVVEFALVIPIFIMLLAGMIDFGIGLYDYMVIISAARDGARVGATTCGTAPPSCSASITTRVDTASGGLHPNISVTCATKASPLTFSTAICNSGAAKEGGAIIVTATYTYHMIWPLAFGTQIPMGSTAKFMVQ
jgi:Flp pilus assembly protein TadG